MLTVAFFPTLLKESRASSALFLVEAVGSVL